MSWRRTRRTNSNQAFVDMLYNKLIQFFVLFILAFTLINPVAKEADIESKAEIIVSIEWDDGDHDVDLWCRDPRGKTVWYKEQNAGFMMLDRDDLGYQNDMVYVDGKAEIVKINQEIVSIRKLIEGEYICNVFLYGSREVSERDDDSRNLTSPLSVTVLVQKLNPRVTVVYKQTIALEYVGEERTLLRFTINETGNPVNINTIYVPLATPMINETVGDFGT